MCLTTCSANIDVRLTQKPKHRKMKKILLFITSLLLLLHFNFKGFGQDWNIQTIGEVTEPYYTYYEKYFDIDLDSDGTPHCVFRENGQLWYGKWNGIAWEKEEVFENLVPDTSSRATSMRSYDLLIWNDTVFITYFYYYSYSSEKLFLLKNTDEGWINDTIVYGSLSSCSPNAVIGNNPETGLNSILVFVNDGFYYRNQNGVWAFWEMNEACDEFHCATYDNAGNVYFVYDDNYILYFGYYSSGVFSSVVIEDIGSNIYRSNSSITLDNNNTPHISYYDPVNDCLKHAVLGSN